MILSLLSNDFLINQAKYFYLRFKSNILSMRKNQIIDLAIILISFAIAIYFYPRMPEKMASHWNAQGEVDGYMSKSIALFLMPILSLILFLIYITLPKIDPLKQNFKKFRKYYDSFILLLLFFLFYIYLLTLFWNLGFRFDMVQFLIPALCVLFYYCGILIENAKRNWFVGIKTPWTLSSDVVWNKTHKLGGKLFKLSAILAIFGMFLKQYVLYFVILPVIFVSVFTFIYSYYLYAKENK